MTIRARLTLIYAAAAVITLVLAGTVVWWQLGTALRSSLDSALQTRAASVLTALENQGQSGIQANDTSTPPGVFVAIFDDLGHMVDSTAGAPKGLPSPQSSVRAQDVTIGSSTYALNVVKGDGGVQVMAGSSLTALNSTMEQLAGWLVVAGGIGAILSLAGGWALAGRALRPVALLTAEAARIGAADFEMRLPVPGERDELQALAITLNQMLERVAEALKRQQAFVAAASHDLRTPIAALRAELELADDVRTTVEELRASVRAAHAEATRLGELAAALLDLAGADTHGRALVRTYVRADEVLASVERRTAPLARERGIRVTTSGSNRVVRVDRVRIEQALTNLVANAIAYSPTGSVVDMIAAIASTGPTEPAELNDTLTIEVLDRGPGIPPGEGDAVFLPFHRGRGTTVPGAGLGLATAAAAVHAHHGTIGFEPRNGGGTRFWIRVPV